MYLNGSRIRNLLTNVAPIRGSEWVHYHNTGVDGSFGCLGGGYGTWILHARFNVPVAGYYGIVLDPTPHAQAVHVGSPLQGLAWASQNGKSSAPKSINAGDRVVCYLDPGVAELRLQLPIAGNGTGVEPSEPNLALVAGPTAGDVLLLVPAIVPLPVAASAPGPTPAGAPAPPAPPAVSSPPAPPPAPPAAPAPPPAPAPAGGPIPPTI